MLALADGTLVRGDVEIHRRASDWRAHGHMADPAYCNVLLHVVGVLDGLTFDAQGRLLPTVAIEPERGPPPPPLPVASSSAASVAAAQRLADQLSLDPCLRDPALIVQRVEAAGRTRLAARAARFEGDLSVVEPDQVLWRGMAEALGYARNTAPFGQLADAVPWAEAARAVAERGPVGLAGLLLGMAGLIGEATLAEAHALRAVQRRHGLRVAVPAATWDRRGLRAGNAPTQRCRGLAELAARWPRLADQALEVVRQAASERKPKLWRFAWASPWIGRGRAQVIAINVLLPFALAAGLAEAADVFERLAAEPTNRVVRYMAQQLAVPGVRFRGACQQQGLLHLFKLTCATRLCERCPARGINLTTLPMDAWP